MIEKQAGVDIIREIDHELQSTFTNLGEFSFVVDLGVLLLIPLSRFQMDSLNRYFPVPRRPSFSLTPATGRAGQCFCRGAARIR